ncbi:unnamed protein product [Cyberlindnera jadinii]|uniref:Uncharacterized protein n=1 Tax=Cyberlindnera jadinii (strain ATCC 18201 / CBS 1600 / BCRC 20928 / JCM 3617 / NBRC 0987 / NRRL Y-1542) TaxID=983966 RepID=A0A0H5C915_CYBJN|nr:unnamed protein product [Cyberlindnera jadinii]
MGFWRSLDIFRAMCHGIRVLPLPISTELAVLCSINESPLHQRVPRTQSRGLSPVASVSPMLHHVPIGKRSEENRSARADWLRRVLVPAWWIPYNCICM